MRRTLIFYLGEQRLKAKEKTKTQITREAKDIPDKITQNHFKETECYNKRTYHLPLMCICHCTSIETELNFERMC